MIYFTTGANGAGKTLLTLKDVRDQQRKENRPVYYHGFEMDPAKAAEFGWQEFDPRKWQDLPDGSICIMDECQNEFPIRRSGSEVPDYINAIAQFRRKRGFDFWLIAPHPSLVDVFIRRLIDKPSWHRHLKRAFGADVVSELRFSSPDLKCEEPGAGARAEVRMVPYPKEVYSWYRSASLHTGKRRIPKQVYVVAVAAILIPALGWFAWSKLPGGNAAKIGKPTAAAVVTQAGPAAVPLDPVQYAATFKPRVPGLPQTAPRYDDLTKPVEAPYPAACIRMADRCTCYTQQGTRLDTPPDLCRQVVAKGFFVDWKLPAPAQPLTPPLQSQGAPEGLNRPAPAGSGVVTTEGSDGATPHAEPVAPAPAPLRSYR